MIPVYKTSAGAWKIIEMDDQSCLFDEERLPVRVEHYPQQPPGV
jgi:hypothetical protein